MIRILRSNPHSGAVEGADQIRTGVTARGASYRYGVAEALSKGEGSISVAARTHAAACRSLPRRDGRASSLLSALPPTLRLLGDPDSAWGGCVHGATETAVSIALDGPQAGNTLDAA